MPEPESPAADAPRRVLLLGGATALVGGGLLALAVVAPLWIPRLYVPPSGRGALLDIFGIFALMSRLPAALLMALAILCALVLLALAATYLRLGLRTLHSGTWTDSLRLAGYLSSGLAALTATFVISYDPTGPPRTLAAVAVAVLGSHGVLLATRDPARDPGRVARWAVVGATLVILATILTFGL